MSDLEWWLKEIGIQLLFILVSLFIVLLVDFII